MKAINPLIAFEHKRDAYGFAVRPQHVQRYREYANIYKEEEEERSDRWTSFLEREAGSIKLAVNGSYTEEGSKGLSTQEKIESVETDVEGDNVSSEKPGSDTSPENVIEKEEKQAAENRKNHKIQIWTVIRPSLRVIEDMMSSRVKKKVNQVREDKDPRTVVSPMEDAKMLKGSAEEDSEDEFYDVERSDPIQDSPSTDNVSVSTMVTTTADATPFESSCPWKEELEVLVRGLWQAFVGVRARRVDKYYQDLLKAELNTNHVDKELDNHAKDSTMDHLYAPEKWKGQIEKAMNFFAALLLLLMPEENAFWALMGIIDNYFDGYYSEEMIESQVDQLVFEELVRERFPKLVNHLDYLGVQVAWVAGPWFLSIFMNMLPWESVLRVWDVLLYEGNRVMLFRTALALMELYGTGPALVTTKDAGDAVTLLQSLAGSTFDSSQLVLTACMGYQNVNETRLRELRNKHRPAVMTAVEERTKGLQAWRDSHGLASKLYNFKHDPKSILIDKHRSGDFSRSESGSTNADDVVISLTGDGEVDTTPDLQDQVVWLKVELCKLLEEKRSAVLRAEELETALMEMVKQDNRRQLSARVEELEREVSQLQRALADKQEQENAMLQVLMRVEQEQRLTEDARRYAEQDAAAQRYAAQVLQEKYEEAMASLAQMEKRVVMAESMLEATLQYQSGQLKTQHSPRTPGQAHKANQEAVQDIPPRKVGLLARPSDLDGVTETRFGKPANVDEAENGKSFTEEQSPSNEQEANGHSVKENE
ncbi:hypothetical protein K2173_011709 [Erythroxylum novogranatense]|uniref:Rab-GAP TBC domain-containing protein n=1 Tax=Erythroxylum novogranatense TaxID=1862640 RepID=A0AAV8T0L5_9ROSI|nr:hypothetical protein K2173_011709 [Erythroxylum novogranatense]